MAFLAPGTGDHTSVTLLTWWHRRGCRPQRFSEASPRSQAWRLVTGSGDQCLESSPTLHASPELVAAFLRERCPQRPVPGTFQTRAVTVRAHRGCAGPGVRSPECPSPRCWSGWARCLLSTAGDLGGRSHWGPVAVSVTELFLDLHLRKGRVLRVRAMFPLLCSVMKPPLLSEVYDHTFIPKVCGQGQR